MVWLFRISGFLVVGALLYVDAFSAKLPPRWSNHQEASARSASSRIVTLHLVSRRATVEVLVLTSMTVLLPSVQPSLASGGATAGGAYLLSAKQRYNERVKEGVRGFLALKGPLESSNIDGVRAYFSSEDVGSWKDLAAAGYLLANAFRRNSSAAPDTLPSVKAWKKFAAEVEGMTKALKKKDTAAAMSSFQSATEALEAYLSQVELPSAKEIASS